MMETKLAVAMRGITKKFGNFVANDQVNISVGVGRVHAIVGENGAGKSTIVKILSGFYHMDGGSIEIHEKPAQIKDTIDAIRYGIGTVHQHFMLINAMTVLDNIILGSYPAHTGMVIRYPKLRAEIEALSKEYQLDVDLDAKVVDLPVGIKQRVEILKAVFRHADILVLDEPSAVLTPLEVAALFHIIRKIKKSGKTVLIITHKLSEVMEISDTITVMRGGKVVADLVTSQTKIEEIAGLMVGHSLTHYERDQKQPGDLVLSVQNLSYKKKNRTVLDAINLEVRAGQIVGIAGVSGNGQIDLEEALTGMINEGLSGEAKVKGISILGQTPKTLRARHISHIPADRIERGFVSSFSNAENSVLGYHVRPIFQRRFGFLNFKQIFHFTQKIIQNFDVRPPKEKFFTKKLSGGNQQKLVVGRELESEPEVLIVAEPTRGVDIGSIELIHQKIFEARKNGVAILLFSSELEEIKKLADRSFVMHRGKLVAEIDWAHDQESKIGMMMIGQRENEKIKLVVQEAL